MSSLSAARYVERTERHARRREERKARQRKKRIAFLMKAIPLAAAIASVVVAFR